ncbi:hypothetical protein [Geoalkalibacter halelectricus]|uniref:Zinc-or iron-chelating domain-containing protein n=1 Tax=Geoalkalibacter halelectricus TaxID=2847045 RepID=A0ABY5ZTS6_9BACT|nr:hypothetical protein [Geoalkalibacter halelectricus]MDO3376788.1 hypothetical protein [Geoalkalibacter halelectricus]UWZ81260.1 hypothetical protein L9S41_07685 [Geoalkalibacter halelectricus]
MDEFASDPQICRQCRGLCCQGHPGAWADPGRFLARFFARDQVDIAFLRSTLPFLGMELRDLAGVPVPAPRSGPWGCIHLGKDGCKLPTTDRPDQCLALVPEIDTLMEGEIRCTMPAAYGTGTIRETWRQFWALES